MSIFSKDQEEKIGTPNGEQVTNEQEQTDMAEQEERDNAVPETTGKDQSEPVNDGEDPATAEVTQEISDEDRERMNEERYEEERQANAVGTNDRVGKNSK